LMPCMYVINSNLTKGRVASMPSEGLKAEVNSLQQRQESKFDCPVHYTFGVLTSASSSGTGMHPCTWGVGLRSISSAESVAQMTEM
jgi:hypothetical protein